jgi:hypothetical protein
MLKPIQLTPEEADMVAELLREYRAMQLMAAAVETESFDKGWRQRKAATAFAALEKVRAA